MKKKIDVIVPFYTPPFLGGTETVLREWNEWFRNNETEVDVRFVVPFKQKDGYIFKTKDKNDIIAPSLFNNSLMVKLSGMVFLLVFLLFTQAEAVIVLSPKYIRLSKFVQRLFRKKFKVISWMHFSLDSLFSDAATVFRTADYHMAISTGIQQQLINMGVAESRISVVFNPVSKKKDTIESANAPMFLFVGRLEMRKQKNVVELLEGFNLLRKTLSDAKLKIIGDGIDRAKLESFSFSLGIDSAIEFLGYSKNPFSDVNNATALVLTSNFEGLPMVLLEAISHGLPVVSSDIQTGPADIVNSNNGRLYLPGDIAMLAQQMQAIYEKKMDRFRVQDSITEFYEDEYFSKIVSILEDI